MSGEPTHRKEIFGLVEFGFFLVLVGVIFTVTPNLYERILDFIRDLKPEQIYPKVFLPVPSSDHPVFYNAVFQFSLAFALFEVAVLTARLFLKEPMKRKVESFSGLLFWLGMAASSSALKDGGISWPAFIGCIITLIGVVIVVRSTALLYTRLPRHKPQI